MIAYTFAAIFAGTTGAALAWAVYLKDELQSVDRRRKHALARNADYLERIKAHERIEGALRRRIDDLRSALTAVESRTVSPVEAVLDVAAKWGHRAWKVL